MTAKKEQTAAEKYAALKEQRFEEFIKASFADDVLKKTDLFEVKCPSGMVFKCRRLDMEYFKNSGSMPMSLSSVVANAQEGEQNEADQIAAFEKLTPAQRTADMQLAAQIVRYVTVEPFIVVGAVNGHKNAISSDDLTLGDFQTIKDWALGGGGAADSLKTFRRKR